MDGFAAFNIPLMSGILNYLGILAIFFGAFWLNLQILFPSSRTLAQKYPVATYVIIYAPLILMLIVANFLEIRSLGYIILTLIACKSGPDSIFWEESTPEPESRWRKGRFASYTGEPAPA